MNSFEVLNPNNIGAWFALAAILALSELISPSINMPWNLAAVAASILTGLFLLLLPFPLTYEIQFLVFVVFWGVIIYTGKRYLRYLNAAEPNDQSLNRRGHRLVGTIITVDRVTSPDWGKARVGDSFWTISGNDLVVGTEMQVVELEGNVLVVEKQESQ